MGSVNFDRAAGYYDATRALPADSMNALTAMLAAELAGRGECLEVGVGTGRIALPLRERGIKLAGMDISGAMLRQMVANAEGGPPPLLQADVTRLPLAAGVFGSVLAVNVLHLIPDWRTAVDEVVRVLRPGGALVTSFPGDGRSSRLSRDTAGAAPWAGAVREALRRHGLVRTTIGARDPDQIAGYLAGRAAARPLEAVTVRQTWTLGQALDSLERQLFSWTWHFDPDKVRAAVSDIRAWAARENMPLTAEHQGESHIRWWMFDLLPATA